MMPESSYMPAISFNLNFSFDERQILQGTPLKNLSRVDLMFSIVQTIQKWGIVEDCQKLKQAIYKAYLKEFNGFRDVSYIPYKIKEPCNKLNIKLGMPLKQLVKQIEV